MPKAGYLYPHFFLINFLHHSRNEMLVFVLHYEFAYALQPFALFPFFYYERLFNIVCCFQKDDLRAVVNYLRADGNVSLIGLWGHSMGAVTR